MNLSVMVSAVSSARLVNVATPPDTVAVRSLERAGAAGERRRDHRAAVARLEVAVLVLLIDHRLDVANGWPAVAVADGWVLDHQLAGRRRADDDARRRSPRSGRRR